MPVFMKTVTRGLPLLTGQFLRLELVGTIGFIVDASVLRLVVSLLGLNLYVGRVISLSGGGHRHLGTQPHLYLQA